MLLKAYNAKGGEEVTLLEYFQRYERNGMVTLEALERALGSPVVQGFARAFEASGREDGIPTEELVGFLLGTDPPPRRHPRSPPEVVVERSLPEEEEVVETSPPEEPETEDPPEDLPSENGSIIPHPGLRRKAKTKAMWRKRETLLQERIVQYTTVDAEGNVQELVETERSSNEVMHMECNETGEFAHREAAEFEQLETFNNEVVAENRGNQEYVHLKSQYDEVEYMDSNNMPQQQSPGQHSPPQQHQPGSHEDGFHGHFSDHHNAPFAAFGGTQVHNEVEVPDEPSLHHDSSSQITASHAAPNNNIFHVAQTPQDDDGHSDPLHQYADVWINPNDDDPGVQFPPVDVEDSS